ncbi:putative peptidoglycan lipid II flippase [Sediminihabitans luteus]|uniref:Putative peptidoglycan lipid II flippase n=1 Tax=Sediminihabitans luteus TaxID=1138585 RepID=A0A2M9D1G3_9CELL|nr:murein biosynthesis integral membrane protein MurJ [Sediminihabitans luteus]PJJ77987.1 putative peptidoglycan lipid II flippase [Sediminihabitans luteus]GIJ00639.1 hypothetical protein Slu03_30160 [Sediminihabitans luteus]
MRHARPTGRDRRARAARQARPAPSDTSGPDQRDAANLAGDGTVPPAVDEVPDGDGPVGDGAPPARKAQSLGRSSMIMAAGTAVSRGLGLVRNVLLVGAIGTTGLAADAFDIANRIPNFMFAILAGGMLNAVLVPQIVRSYRERNPEERIGKLLTLAALIMLVMTLVLTAAASFVVTIYSGGKFTPAQQSLAVAFAFWCIPQLFFYGLYALLGQVLNARGQFGPYMWSPIVNNIVSIVGFSIFIAVYGPAATGHVDDMSSWDGPKIALLAGTATLGIVGQAVILFWPLYRGGFRWRVRLGLHGIGLRTAGAVAMWTFGAVLLEQLGTLVVSRFAASAPDAARALGESDVAGPAAYTQALMIYLLPHSLVTVSVATALFTGMSAAAGAGDVARVRTLLSRGVRTVGVFTVFATAVMVVLALPLTKLLVPTVGADAAVAVSQVLVAMSLGLVPLGGMVLMKWVFYAFEDGRSVFWIQALGTVLLIGAAWAATLVLDPRWWVVGLAAAMSLSNALVVVLRAFGLRRRLDGLDTARIVRLHVRLVVAAGVAAVAGWGVRQLFGDLHGLSWGLALLVTACTGLLMLAVYVGLLRLMRVQELADLVGPLTARLRRG